jgi:hypothetical protein
MFSLIEQEWLLKGNPVSFVVARGRNCSAPHMSSLRSRPALDGAAQIVAV